MTAEPLVPLVITEQGLYPDIPEDEYHADPVAGGSLSQSGAKLLLPPNCPAVYKYNRDHGGRHSKSMDTGTRVHALVLGKGHEHLAMLDFANYRTDKAKAARDAAIAAGKIPTLPHELEEAQEIAAAVTGHEIAGGLLAQGDAEQSVFWRDETWGIWKRARLDWLTWFDGMPTIADVKTTADASPEKFAKSCAEYGYYMQDPYYRDGLAAILGCDWRDIDFVFIAVPTAPPYLVMTYRLDDQAIALGRQQAAIASEKYRDCSESGYWPAWAANTLDLTLPRYAASRITGDINDWYDHHGD